MKMALVDDAQEVKVSQSEILSRWTKFGEIAGMATKTGILTRDIYCMNWLVGVLQLAR